MSRSSFSCPPVKEGSEPQANGGLGFDDFQNPFAYRFETLPDFVIAHADDSEAVRLQRRRSRQVMSFTFGSEMAVSIDLDDEPLGRAIEVRDVLAERLLPRELARQMAQEQIPELALRRRRIATLIAGGAAKRRGSRE